MANSPGVQAQYGAIIDGIALLNNVQPSSSSSQLTRVSSAARGRAASPAEPYQRSRSTRPGSRAGAPASLGVPVVSVDSAVSDSSHDINMQPSFTSNLQMKTTRPASRERVSSAWGSPQHGVSSQQQRSQNACSSWMPAGHSIAAEISASRAAIGYQVQAQPMSRQVTAPQATRANRASVPGPSLVCSARGFRPASAQKKSPAMVPRPVSRQQQHQESASSGKAEADVQLHS